ncbi:Sds3-like-domain-containing protein [Immersiella caudata]|uniref:Sds3-like-domain-containing protein n=1 Tax=Immersiella caudata TaxID=314043 RepID=A0AA39XDN8_9PEZI|nr:Sds3-like-domain-containing protein [Immersiella caudata]
MATDTAPALALSSPPPHLLDNSPSNLSSPLSDVEDKDADPDEMDLDMRNHTSGRPGTPKRNANGTREDSEADSDSDEESKLSEMDINDSEAETERLYDTPPKNGAARDMLSILGEVGSRQFVDRRERVFERSPSKLQQQLQAELDAENAVTDGDSLSEAEDEDEDDASVASSEPEPAPVKEQPLRSPSQAKKNQEANTSTNSAASQLARQDSQESRKRKRTSLAEQSESEQPLRKRTGSIGAPEGEFSADDAIVADDEGGISTNPQSGNHTGEEDNGQSASVVPKNKEEPVASVEDESVETGRTKKAKRNSAKKRNSKSPDESIEQATEEAQDDPPDDAEEPIAGDTAAHIDDEHNEDPDEAEAAHKNEEELERKKAAWEELTAIEKQFSNFRERLYQERLDQLNQEEAMLNCEIPTHPEYLAMLKCIEDRRQERIRLSELELKLNISVLRRRAIAERAQMMSQYYQAVRESREKVLEELGQDWYEIQQERRRYANTIPDYGIPFPTSKTQTIRQAVAYNKEVSILSGFAKHVGFPAAPPIYGASEDQLESDLEAMRAREPQVRPSHLPQFQSHGLQPEKSPAGNLFSLVGPAGEQFLEHTPWANPNHPSHHIQRQQETAVPLPYSGQPSGPRRHSQQHRNMFSSSATTMNGDSPIQTQKTHPPGVHDSLKASRIGAEHPNKRETVAQAS